MGPSSVIGQQLASGRPEESWQPTTLSSSTFYGQKYSVYRPWSRCHFWRQVATHLQTQHPLQDTKNSWKMTWSARRGIHTWPTFKSRVAQTCRQQTKHSKCFSYGYHWAMDWTSAATVMTYFSWNITASDQGCLDMFHVFVGFKMHNT